MYSKLVQKASIKRVDTNWKEGAGIPKNKIIQDLAIDLPYL